MGFSDFFAQNSTIMLCHRTSCAPISCAWGHSAARRFSGITHFQCSDSLALPAVAFSRPAEAEEKHHPARRATRRFARQNGAVSSKPAKVRELSHGIFRNSQAHWGRSPTVAEGGGVSAANVAGLQDLGKSCTEKLPRAKALQFLCLTFREIGDFRIGHKKNGA